MSDRSSRESPTVPTDIVFDLERDAPDLYRALIRTAPAVTDVLRQFRTGVPVMSSAAPGVEGRLYRLLGHNRSVCLALDDDLAAAAVIVLKGSEPLLPDFPQYLDWMTTRQFGAWPRPMSEHFPLFEGKAPGVVFLHEAAQEAALAAEVQARHLAHYGELMRLPLPVAVLRAPEDRHRTIVAALQARLSAPAFDRIATQLERGIGIFAYYYPGPPVRVHAVGRPKAFSPAPTTLASRQHVMDVSLPGWLRLAARLLWLGYLPTSPASWRLGDIFDVNNACLDGGVCDVNSILPMSKATGDGFFVRSIVMITGGLRISTARAFGVPLAEVPANYDQELAAFCLGDYLKRAMDRMLDAEARPGLTIDSRVRDVYREQSLPDIFRLLQAFGSYLGASDYAPRPAPPAS